MTHEEGEIRRNVEQFEAEKIETEEAINLLEEHIGDIDEFSPDSAIRYGMKYLTLVQQFHKLDVDIMRKRRAFGLEYSESLEELQFANWRIDEARKGNYLPAKSDLKYQGELVIRIADGDPNMLIRGTAFLKIAQAMPETDTPLTDVMLAGR